jgi:hypothetical protein
MAAMVHGELEKDNMMGEMNDILMYEKHK